MTIKDWLYIVGYVVSVVGLLSAFKYRIKRVEDSNATIKKIIFCEKGGLNIIAVNVCNENTREFKAEFEKYSNKLENLNEDVIQIKTRMNLE